MIALGADVSTTAVDLVSLDEDGRIRNYSVPVADARGARRLIQVRAAVAAAVRGRFDEDLAVAVAVVEIPWARSGSSFALLSIAAVTLEAIQHARPGAVVLDLPTQSWKLDSVGHGNATKGEVLDHARGLGYDGSDQNVADATCMAQAGWERWTRAVGDPS